MAHPTSKSNQGCLRAGLEHSPRLELDSSKVSLTPNSTPDAAAAQERLAGARIRSRVFPYSPDWLRLARRAPRPDCNGWGPRWEAVCGEFYRVYSVG